MAKIFFDENLPKKLAAALDLLSKIKDPSIEVVHLFDKFPAGTKDVDWMKALGSEGGWSVITMDHNKGTEEWRVFRESGLTTFRLAKSWMDLPQWDRAKKMINAWDAIVEKSKQSKKYYRVQINGKLEEIIVTDK